MGCHGQATLRNLSRKITVLFAEPHPLVYRYLARLLRTKRDIHVTASCDCDGGPINQDGSVLVLLADKRWTRKPLAVYTQNLEVLFPTAKILFLGDSTETKEICQLLMLGAVGYVPYKQLERQLQPALRAVAAGRIWVTPKVLEEFVQYAQQRDDRFHSQCGSAFLTGREGAVLSLLSNKLSNKEIAYELKISERTVRFHLHNIFLKLGVGDRFSAIEIMRGDSIQKGNGIQKSFSQSN